MDSFIYNGQVYREGDRVMCELDCSDSNSCNTTPDGWIIINDAKISSITQADDSIQFYICQNYCVGCSCRKKLGYKYSWCVNVFDSSIICGDTRKLRKVDSDCMSDIITLAYPIKAE